MPGFELYTKGKALHVKLPFGEQAPKPTGGGAIISTVARPRRKALTEWVGDEPLGLVLTYKLTAWESMQGSDIEKKIRTIQRMRGLGEDEPPQVIVMGDPDGCVPHDYTDAPRRRWWVVAHEEDDGTQRNDVGNRIDVSGTITLLEVSEDTTLGRLPKARSKKKSSKKKKRYTVKKGDTLSGIAAKFKIKGGWKRLAKINNIRDPKSIKPGQVIRLDD